MILSPAEWHQRFRLQARWTQDLRQHLYPRAGLDRAARVLDVGCGTGALQAELSERSRSQVHGLDLNLRFLEQAVENNPAVQYVAGDAHALPYAGACFDISLCHFLLLWVENPEEVLSEMRRVTRVGGALIALAEPDYGGRIDHPPELAQIGLLQASSLRQQGAQPEMGRRLAGLFSNLGLHSVETGVLGAQWSGPPLPEELASEWAVIRSDLKDLLSKEQLDKLQERETQALARRERVLFVPTFYAWGRVPE
jgi:SAM-dependent methyltransferase